MAHWQTDKDGKKFLRFDSRDEMVQYFGHYPSSSELMKSPVGRYAMQENAKWTKGTGLGDTLTGFVKTAVPIATALTPLGPALAGAVGGALKSIPGVGSIAGKVGDLAGKSGLTGALGKVDGKPGFGIGDILTGAGGVLGAIDSIKSGNKVNSLLGQQSALANEAAANARELFAGARPIRQAAETRLLDALNRGPSPVPNLGAMADTGNPFRKRFPTVSAPPAPAAPAPSAGTSPSPAAPGTPISSPMPQPVTPTGGAGVLPSLLTALKKRPLTAAPAA